MSQSLKGQFLIAGKGLRDPNFFRTVVLMVEHSDEGAMGLVVNRPSSVAVAHALSEHFNLPETEDLVYVGGPVEPAALFILHNSADHDEATAQVVSGIYIGSNAHVFESVVREAGQGNSQLRFRIFSGCAGWAPGQLEAELGRGDWHLLPASSEFIWDFDAYMLWDAALQKVHIQNRILPHLVKNPEWN